MAPQKAHASTGTSIATHSHATKITKSTKPGRPMKQIFRGKVMSFSGDFSSIGWDHEKMAKWIKVHGGEYAREVNEDTTHLICTIDDYKKKTPQVKKAQALGSDCNIVVSDWLDDCLDFNNTKKRCRNEKGYSLARVVKRVNQTTAAQNRYRASFEDGVRASQEMVDNRESFWNVYNLPLKGPKYIGLNHLYVDHTGFEYKVICTRINTEGKVKSEKYTIFFFESNCLPPHYMVGSKLSQPGRPPSYWREECHPKPFWEAFRDFTKFFEKITGIEWDDRLDGGPSRLHDPFKYIIPVSGRPYGHVSPDKKHPVQRAIELEQEQERERELEKQNMMEVALSGFIDSGVGLEHDSESDEEHDSDSDGEQDDTDSETASAIYRRAQQAGSSITISSDSGDDERRSVSIETISSDTDDA